MSIKVGDLILLTNVRGESAFQLTGIVNTVQTVSELRPNFPEDVYIIVKGVKVWVFREEYEPIPEEIKDWPIDSIKLYLAL